ncbi:DUF6362 family protein [Methyloceanibacter caenitepidi]|uniref:DUF6362 domain-containing protein n=1 Tax=Methyloceanibacter caenitepidi TaxID=1384459 RepID=A0A0A8K212_9HYPH|nr:DUF6362 family protein [Methyloceanibacter caenitepidi]BAQ16935.1 hypothetical protein GL4_1479 [Methyloceanibacter caenitepidi]
MGATEIPGLKPRPGLGLDQTVELQKKCLILIDRSVLTLAALPDKERRFQRSPGSGLPEPVYTKQELDAAADFEAQLRASKGEPTRKLRRFRPSPRDVGRYLDVLAWLSELWRSANGPRDVKLIIARAHGVSWWRLTHQYGRSEATLRNWHRSAVAQVLSRHWKEIDRLFV